MELTIAAILTGVAALVTATGGVLLAVRSVRSNERKAASGEITSLSAMLEQERDAVVACELKLYNMRVLLAKNGIEADDSD